MDNQEPRSRARLAASVVLVVVIGASIIAAAYLRTSPSPTSTSTSTTSSQSATSSSIQPLSSSASCVIAAPYDSIQEMRGGCGYYFSVSYNGCCYAQKLANGSEETNLGWTLIIGARQSTGPTENSTFGWDPAGPSTASGERLPSPVSSTLFNGTLTIQWRLYNSTTPLLYAWIVDSFPVPEQFLVGGSPSASCPTASWPSQISTTYQPAVQQIELDPAFLALTGGLCYSYAGNSYSLNPSGGGNVTSFFFSRYNGTIVYPCGEYPAKLVVSQIAVNAIFNGKIDGITEMVLENDLRSSFNQYECGGGVIPVAVHSVTLVPPYTPAGPTIEVTLSASLEQTPITNLTAVLSLTGKNQTFEFSGVSASSPLLQGQLASQTETVVGPVSVDTNATYPMTIEGSFQDGQAFSYQVTVQVQATTTLTPPAHRLSIQVDKSSYLGGESILINGSVSPTPSAPSNVTITVKGPAGVMAVSTAQVSTSNGSYSYRLVTGSLSEGWVAGTYSVTGVWVALGQNESAAANFEFLPYAAG